jgi:hypothetical protein
MVQEWRQKGQIKSMNGENLLLLVTDEPVEFEK